MTNQTMELLSALSVAFGPTGCESYVLKILEDAIGNTASCTKDQMGNLICHLPGKGEKTMIVAHTDEVGFMVTNIDDSGYVRVEPTGTPDPACFLGKELLVGNEETLLAGVGGGKVLHLLSGGERSDLPGFEKLFIDLGVKKREELEGKIEKGDFAAYAGEFFTLGDDYVVGKALDARAGCAVAVEALRKAAERNEEERKDLYFVFAAKEKAGLSTAVTAAFNIAPQAAILLGFEPAKGYKEEGVPQIGALPGSGTVLSMKDGTVLFYDTSFFENAKRIAEEEKIACQLLDSPLPISSGRLHLTERGIPTVSLRIPCINPETPLAIMHKNDIDETLKLLLALI